MEQIETLNRLIEPGHHWHALYTRHQHEKTIASVLTNKKFEVFLPLYSAVHSWKDRQKQLVMPLFPCYVFVRGGLDRKLDIITTPGVHAFVTSAGQPAAIPEEQIDAVRRATENSLRVEPHPFLKTGDRVRVKAGLLEGVEGILIRKKNIYRLVISVELLGSSAAVEVDSFSVERIATSSGAVASHLPLPNTLGSFRPGIQTARRGMA